MGETEERPPGLVEPNSTPMRTANRARFELELEFVQALANPFYLENLASEGLLQDASFINYLEYLQYWRKREYARFIVPALFAFFGAASARTIPKRTKQPGDENETGTLPIRTLENMASGSFFPGHFVKHSHRRSGPATQAEAPTVTGEAKTPGGPTTPGVGRTCGTPAASRRASSLHPGGAATSVNGTPAPQG
ncbi:Mediator of RNA polymerase II transcription subunit 31 [Ceratobasidium theobromae]|uniref:Mediator of RNA polymerase II transcription subunit 31 n=1 Tax=Ceratobasidium theobromae TaxID=1582974 RepID=A0A5N5QYT0_9AGAM|nr:Mediator of RNA polymerase II transcription subunit 31 [Ceratobasidium theobromae]